MTYAKTNLRLRTCSRANTCHVLLIRESGRTHGVVATGKVGQSRHGPGTATAIGHVRPCAVKNQLSEVSFFCSGVPEEAEV